MSHILTVAVSLALSAALTPTVRALAHRSGWLDTPTARKVKTRPLPRLGGVAIAAAFFAAVALAAALGVGDATADFGTSGFLVTMVGGGLMLVLGVVDDLIDLRARSKLVGQVVIAVVVVALGVSITELGLPWGVAQLGFAGPVLTVVWIVAVVNAVNLIDGLDGLASGVVLTAVAALYVVGSAQGDGVTLVALVALAGAVVGFLIFNFHPASIIMGDGGSMFLGFMLASAAIALNERPGPPLPAAVPVLLLGLPLVDTAMAIIRRARLRVPLFRADREHIHHKLLARGNGHRAAVLLLVSASAAFAALAVVAAWTGSVTAGLILVGAIVAGVAVAARLDASEGSGAETGAT